MIVFCCVLMMMTVHEHSRLLQRQQYIRRACRQTVNNRWDRSASHAAVCLEFREGRLRVYSRQIGALHVNSILVRSLQSTVLVNGCCQTPSVAAIAGLSFTALQNRSAFTPLGFIFHLFVNFYFHPRSVCRLTVNFACIFVSIIVYELI